METNCKKGFRVESDLIGPIEVPECALYGVQTLRGIENFKISKFHLNEYPEFIKGLAITKQASACSLVRRLARRLSTANSMTSSLLT